MAKKRDGFFTKDKYARLFLVGNFLRKTKIDELPQIRNILIGDMSLLGPRSERPHFVKASYEEKAMFDLRHLVKPDVTGWVQLNLPTATPKENLEKLEYDLYYIKNSLFFLI